MLLSFIVGHSYNKHRILRPEMETMDLPACLRRAGTKTKRTCGGWLRPVT